MMAKIFMIASFAWISPFIAKMQKNLAIFKKGIVIGVTFPKEAEDDEEIKGILSSFIKENGVCNKICLLLFALSLLVKKLTLFVGLSCLWLDIVIVAFNVIQLKYYKKLRNIKEERYTRKDEAGSRDEVLVNLSAILSPNWISPWIFALFGAVCLVPIIFDKTNWIFSLINVAQIVFFYFCYRYCFRTKMDDYNRDVNLSFAMTLVRRASWGKFWVLICLITCLYSFAMLPTAWGDWLFIIATIVYMLVLCIGVFRIEMKLRNTFEKLSKDAGTDCLVDEDDNWIWGMFYYNKNDSHVIVNDRIGLGTTMNMAKPFGKIIMIFALVCMIAMPFLPVILDETIDDDIAIVTSADMLSVSCGRDIYEVDFDDIEEVVLLDNYPENLKRTWGTGTDEILRGTFSSKEYNPLFVCLNPDEGPYLLLKIRGKKYYLFGVKEDGVIIDLYNTVLERHALQ